MIDDETETDRKRRGTDEHFLGACVATLVKFLEEKGFVEREPLANSYRYKVKIDMRKYHGDTVSDVVARYYDNSYLSLVSQFVEEDKMDVQDLKDLIARIEKKKS